jgi:predicted phage tail component-like protein
MDLDFVGFTYNGKHSYRDLKIYRTSNGGRYEENILPTLTEKTASVDGMVGQYYFGTQVGPRTLNISFAFDDVTEAGLQEIKRTFCGDGIHDLIFDEEPYKVYSAKVTGTATVKHLCFDKEGNRRYRGEGSVQFTCYYPHAHSRRSIGETYALPTKYNITYKYNSNDKVWEVDDEAPKEVTCGIIVNADEIISCPTFLSAVTAHYLDENGSGTLNLSKNYSFPKKVMITRLAYTYKSLDALTEEFDDDNEAALTIKVGGVTYYYTTKKCFEVDIHYSLLSGKVLNHYNIIDFPTKWQWGQACGLPLHVDDGRNHGEMPAYFEVEAEVLDSNKKFSSGTTITVANNSITLNSSEQVVKWNSKTGLVTNGNNVIRIGGEPLVTIPVGRSGTITINPSVSGA